MPVLNRQTRPRDGHLTERLLQVQRGPLPRHVAIIMDGNGRWARQRNKERTQGHRAGLEAAARLVEFVNSELKLEYLTLYAFSKENWRRPRPEVDYLMNLLVDFLRGRLHELLEKNVRLRVLGDLPELPPVVQRELLRALTLSAQNEGLNLSLAINYGGRQEIMRAVNGILHDLRVGKLNGHPVDEQLFRKYLYTDGLPDPDLLIRTSGEERVSNFLLWQIAYAEFWVTQTLWPDFTPDELLAAIETFQTRARRFGGLDEQ